MSWRWAGCGPAAVTLGDRERAADLIGYLTTTGHEDAYAAVWRGIGRTPAVEAEAAERRAAAPKRRR